MKRVLLVSLGVSRKGFSQFARFLPMTAVGLHYIASILKQGGYLVELINQTNDGLSNIEIVQKIKSLKSDYVFFNQFFNTRESVKSIISKIKTDSIVVIGGHDITFHSQKLQKIELNQCYRSVDYIWQGEVEECLLSEMPLMTKQTQPVIVDRLHNRVNDLDTLPILKHNDYSGDVGFLVTSRGCYKRGCDICTTPSFYPNGWKSRSIDHVKEEINALKCAGKRFVFICDDNFLGFTNKDLWRGHQIILACKEAKIKIMIMTIKEQILQAEQKQYLSQWTGTVYRCFLGIESGGTHVQNKLGKITNPVTHAAVSVKAIQTLHNNGIALFAGWINFKPDSTFSELQQDASFLHKTGECAVFTNLCQSLRIYEGTNIYTKHCHRNVKITKGEFDYDFDLCGVGLLYRFLMFTVRNKLTDMVDNLLFEITDLIYINQLQNDVLGILYQKIKSSLNEHNYIFFMQCLDFYKNKTSKIDTNNFIDQMKSYYLMLYLLRQKIKNQLISSI